VSDLHAQLLAGLSPLNVAEERTPEELAAALRAVVELCTDKMGEAVGGGLTDCDTLWPSEVLQAIARELGVDG
jgi:hypothetical protein